MTRKKSTARRSRKMAKAKPSNRKHTVKRRKQEPMKRDAQEFETLIEVFPPGVMD